MTGYYWAESELALLRAGLRDAEVARRTGRTLVAVRQCRRRLGIRVECSPAPRSLSAYRETIVQMYAAGASSYTIAEAIGGGDRRSVRGDAATIRALLAREGVPLRAASVRRHQRPDRDELKAMYHRLGSISRAATHYGVSAETVRRWLSALDIPRLPAVPRQRGDTKRRRPPPAVGLLRSQRHIHRMSLNEMARWHDVSPRVIKRWLRDAGIDVGRLALRRRLRDGSSH